MNNTLLIWKPWSQFFCIPPYLDQNIIFHCFWSLFSLPVNTNECVFIDCFLFVSYRYMLYYMQVICPLYLSHTHTYTLTFKHTEIKHNLYKIIISFFHHMFCYTKYWFIIQNNKKEEFRFFRRMNMISGSQLSFVIHGVWCIQHQMSLLQILYWSFSLSHNSLNSLRTVLIRNEALWDITYSERLWCQIS